jgi:hypothetical protein
MWIVVHMSKCNGLTGGNVTEFLIFLIREPENGENEAGGGGERGVLPTGGWE